MDPRELSEQVLLGPVFDALPLGVVVLDEAGVVRVFNKHEEKLANRVRERVIGRPFFEAVAPCMNVRELAGEFFDHVSVGRLDTRVEFSFPFPHVDQPRDVVVRLQSVIVTGRPHGLLLVEDVSAERAVERLKESLATLLVHDFKNPLSVIRSNLDFLRTLVSLPDATDAIDDSVVATERLHPMVLNLLDIARLETRSYPIERRTTSLSTLVEEAVRANGALARAVGVVLQSDAPKAIAAELDAAAVRRCLNNLIENAIRHAPTGSRVVVTAYEDGADVLFGVADNGPGVPMDLRSAIFDKFTQGASSGRQSDNRGLGLTFVQLVARAHGGEVSIVDSRPHGATFLVRIPRKLPDVTR